MSQDLSKCQHCDQPVEWGKTEQGFAGFVHVANELAACPEFCVTCHAPVHPLAVFPAPTGADGVRCLDCYAASTEGRQLPTAEELTSMWGGSAR